MILEDTPPNPRKRWQVTTTALYATISSLKLSFRDRELIYAVLAGAAIRDQSFPQAADLRDHEKANRSLKRHLAATKANRTRKRRRSDDQKARPSDAQALKVWLSAAKPRSESLPIKPRRAAMP